MRPACLSIFLVLVAACGPSPADDKVLLTYQVDANRLDRAYEVIEGRLDALDLDDVWTEKLPPDRIVLHFSTDDRRTVGIAKRVVARLGTLEFLIVAPRNLQETERGKRKEQGEAYRAPDGHRWVPARTEGQPDTFVEIPDATDKGWGFTGADLNPADLGVQPDPVGAGWMVLFAVKPERVQDFTDFTGANIKRQMALVIDGEVDLAPEIQTALPGGGQISGGMGGFSKEEAMELVAILRAGALDAKLTLVGEETLR